MNNWVLAAILVGPVMYIAATLAAKSPASAAEYEYGNRELNPSDVLDSSIMYALQVAAIALFATWGHMYGLAAAVVPLFWMTGYFLFCWLLTDEFLEKFAANRKFRTLHDFLADHGASRIVCVVAALMTLVAMSGPAMFEAFAVGRTVFAAAPSLGASSSASLALAFLVIALIYMTRGGFSGVVRLEQLQLAIGYGGFNLAFAAALYLNSEVIGRRQVVIISALCLICALLFFAGKLWYHLLVRRYLGGFESSRAARQTNDLLGWVACSLGVLSYAAVLLFGPAGSGIVAASSNGAAGAYWNLGFSGLALVSLFVANAFFQFVDVTQWQRLLSIGVNVGKVEETNRVLRGNILIGGVCSSLTWVIAVGFGVFLKHLFPEHDPYSVLSHYVSSLSRSSAQIDGWLLFVFLAALIAVMFSTLDSLVAGTSFTVQNDILAGILKPPFVASVLISRASTIIVVMLQLLLYLTVSQLAGDRVDAVLYVCWSFQLAMLPIVVALLRDRGGNAWARVIAMVAGALGASWPLVSGQPDKAYEISPWLTVLVSGGTFLILGGFRRKRRANAELAG